MISELQIGDYQNKFKNRDIDRIVTLNIDIVSYREVGDDSHLETLLHMDSSLKKK